MFLYFAERNLFRFCTKSNLKSFARQTAKSTKIAQGLSTYTEHIFVLSLCECACVCVCVASRPQKYVIIFVFLSSLVHCYCCYCSAAVIVASSSSSFSVYMIFHCVYVIFVLVCPVTCLT